MLRTLRARCLLLCLLAWQLQPAPARTLLQALAGALPAGSAATAVGNGAAAVPAAAAVAPVGGAAPASIAATAAAPAAALSAAAAAATSRAQPPARPPVSPPPTGAAQLFGLPAQAGTFASLAAAAGLGTLLAGPNRARLTVFVPTDDAFAQAFRAGNLSCTQNFIVTGPCNGTAALAAATNLQATLLNHVVPGVFPLAALRGAVLLQSVGGAVLQVTLTDTALFVGNAALARGDLADGAGDVVHLVAAVITTDASFNGSLVRAAAKLGGYGPWTAAKEAEVATSASVYLASYQRLRALVDLPLGGLANPMPLVFQPHSGAAAAAATGTSSRPPAPPPVSDAAPAAVVSAPAPVTVGAVSTLAAVAATSSSAASGSGAGAAGARWRFAPPAGVVRPPDNDSLAYMSVGELAVLLRSGAVSSRYLTDLYLSRLRRYDYVLEAVITYTEELAFAQADAADTALAAGRWLGPLHGVPYGLKDLVAVPGYRTTWGAAPFQGQVIGQEAHVYTRLREAGAVLVAKLATGEMALDDVWFGGLTRSPWNIAVGANGSSSGPAAAVAAALVPFAIGTETDGSIANPADQNGNTAMRPSFGLVGRSGVMSLAESMDKLGPFCRSSADCALVLDAVRGADAGDPSSLDLDLPDPASIDVSQLRVGFLPGTPAQILQGLRGKVASLAPLAAPLTRAPARDIANIVLNVEAAAHFDYWQRAGLDDANRRQDTWPALLRTARTIPAVEYVQAQRARGVLVAEVGAALAGVDAFLGPATALPATGNLAGLPEVIVPVGFARLPGAATGDPRRVPVSAGIFGPVYSDSVLLALAAAFQSDSAFHLQRPPIDSVPPAILAFCPQYAACRQMAPKPPGPAPAPGGLARAPAPPPDGQLATQSI